MVRVSVLADALRTITNAEHKGKRQGFISFMLAFLAITFIFAFSFHNILFSLSRFIHFILVLIRPCSKVILKFLDVMMKHGYIGEYEVVDDHRSGKVVVSLLGRINKCGVISPRFGVPKRNIDEWANDLLPSRQFGYMVLTTSAGIMEHEEAKRKNTGGKILGFFY